MNACEAKVSRHDTNSAYRQGCRCPAAREAWRLYSKRRREGRQQPLVVSSLGTARRLQALAAIGWSITELAVQCDYRKSMIGHLQTRRRPQILRATADRVAEVYERLSMRLGPSCTRTRKRAARLGWAPPLAWDDIDSPTGRAAGAVMDLAADEVAVMRAVAGDLAGARLSHADTQEAIRRLREMGETAAEIARRVGVSRRTAERTSAARAA